MEGESPVAPAAAPVVAEEAPVPVPPAFVSAEDMNVEEQGGDGSDAEGSADNDDDNEDGDDNEEDDAASEGSGPAAPAKRKGIDDDESGDEVVQRKSKKAKLVPSMFDDEAALSGDDSSGDDGDGEEDVNQNEYVQDDFLVLDGDGDKQEEKTKKLFSRLRKNKTNMLLVEDDIALVHENNAAAESASNRPIKKLKKMYDNEIGPERVNRSELLTSDNEQSDDGDDAGDDMDDFLVDDLEDGSDADGEPRVRAPRRQTRAPAYADGPAQEEIDEAFDIFGDDYGDYYGDADRDGEGEDDDESYGDSDDDDLFSDKTERREQRRAAALQKKKSARDQNNKEDVRAMFERSKLIEKFCTERDDELRNTDLPERLQDILPGRTPPDVAERREEAKWISTLLADKLVYEYGGLRKFPRHFDYRSAHELETSLHEAVDFVLSMMQNERYEAPFIWSYRKDYLHEMMTRKHLWWIQSMDIKWEDLVGRRNNLLREVQLVASVAEGSLKEDDLGELKAQLSTVRQRLAQLHGTKQEAQGVYEVALDATDGEDVSADDRAKVTQAALALEEATREVEAATAEMLAVESTLAELNKKLALRSSYPQHLAQEFLKLFPSEKYEPVIRCMNDDLELRDFQNYCKLLSNRGNSSEKSKKKLQGRRALVDEYRHVRHPDIRRYVESFALPASEFGFSLRYDGHRQETPTPEVDVLDLAAQFVCAEFPTPEDVQQAGRKLLCVEMGAEPNVLRKARKYYRNHAKISTEPTDKGVSVINPMHELFGLHTLYMKPIIELLEPTPGPSYYVGGSNRTVYARLVKAERDGLLKIKFVAPESPDKQMLDSFLPLSAPIRGDEIRRVWDVERMNIVISTISGILNPAIETETKRELIRLSKDAIIEETADAYAALVSRGPHRPTRKTFADVVLASPNPVSRYTVLSILLPVGGGDKSSAVFMSFIDQDGLVRSQDSIPYAARSKKREKIAQIMKSTKPDVIVINTSGGFQSTSMEAMIMKYLIKEVQEEIRKDSAALRRSRYEEGYDVPSDDDEDDDDLFEPEVLLLNDDVPQIYGASSRARSAFPGIPPGAAAGVSLARMVQNPVAEYANMWRSADAIGMFGFETLFLDLHPLQSLLNHVRGPLLTALESVLVDAVCEAGVDLNAAVQHDHLAGSLVFVGGLGLRKAEALRFNIQRELGAVSSRRQLMERKLMGKNVYNNAAGFLRICDNDNIDALLDPLDDTRIHPECYVLHDYATKMCASALEEQHNAEVYFETVTKVMKRSKTQIAVQLADECPVHMDINEFRPRWSGWVNDFEDFSLRQASWNATVYDADAHPVRRQVATEVPGETEEILADPITLEDPLDDLVLEEYAAELEATGGGKHFKQLIQIKNELRYPYLDRRLPLPRRPSDAELFTIMTGETDQSLYVGLKVVCCIDAINDSNAYVTIDNGNLRGSVWVNNVKDKVTDSYGRVEDINIREELTEGTYREGVVIRVKKDQRRVEVSLRRSDIERGEDWWFAERSKDENMRAWWAAAGRPEMLDPCFDYRSALNLYYNAEQDREEAMAALMESKNKQSSTSQASKAARPIFHPYFRNIGYQQAEAELQGKAPGEVLFRPSSKGGLSIAWLFHNGIVKHIDVAESGDNAVPGGLGSQLTIRGEKEAYSDLDEIMGRFISPMNDFVAAMVNYRAFKNFSPEESTKWFKDALASNPNQIPYLVRFDREHPGYFLLAWYNANSRTPIKEHHIRVCPEGYNLKEMKFTSPSGVMQWFKANAVARPPAPTEAKRPPPPGAAAGGAAAPPRRKSRFTN